MFSQFFASAQLATAADFKKSKVFEPNDIIMDPKCLQLCSNLVPSSYVAQAQQTWTSRNHIFQVFLEKVS